MFLCRRRDYMTHVSHPVQIFVKAKRTKSTDLLPRGKVISDGNDVRLSLFHVAKIGVLTDPRVGASRLAGHAVRLKLLQLLRRGGVTS